MTHRALAIWLYSVQSSLFLLDSADLYVLDCKKLKFWSDSMIITKLSTEKTDF